MSKAEMRLDRENGRFLGVCAGVANWLDLPAVLVRIVFVICVLAWPPLLIAYFVIYFCVDKDFTPDRIRDYFIDSGPAEHFRRIDYRKPIYRSRSNRRVAGVCAGIADYLEVSAFSVRLVTLLSFFFMGPFTFWGYILCWFVIAPEPRSDAGDDIPASWRERRAARRQRREERREGREGREDREERRAAARQRRAQRHYARNVRNGYNPEEQDADTGRPGATTPPDTAFTDDPESYQSRQECTEVYSDLEQRLRDIEAFMTSKRFRLHCEINRI